MKGLFQCPPWARSFCPFRACCFWSFWALPLLYPSASDFQFPSAGDRWFRAYGAYMRNFSNELIYII